MCFEHVCVHQHIVKHCFLRTVACKGLCFFASGGVLQVMYIYMCIYNTYIYIYMYTSDRIRNSDEMTPTWTCVLQRVEACYSVLQRVAVCCSDLG